MGSRDGETEATAKQCAISTELRWFHSILQAMENNINSVSLEDYFGSHLRTNDTMKGNWIKLFSNDPRD